MRRLASSLLLGALGCAAPALPPAVTVTAPVPSPPPAASPAPELAPAPPEEPAPAPTLPLHRFGALVPGERAQLFAVQGRVMLRAGDRLFSLSPGQIHREVVLEKALAGPSGHLTLGAFGGRHPDALVADRQVREAGKDAHVRQYVRVVGGKVKEIARAKQDAASTIGDSALQIAVLPDGRLVARMAVDWGDNGFGWFDFVPGPKGAREEAMHGVSAGMGSDPLLLQRPDGRVALARGGDKLSVFHWAKGSPEPTEENPTGDGYERATHLFETTDGVLFLLTDKSLYQQTGHAWRRQDAGAPIKDAWPLPSGAALLVTERGEPLVRDAAGAVTRASWPWVTLEGRQFPVRFADAVCTREAGCWAIARDGAGLYHDRAPRELVDLGKLGPGEHGGAP